MGGSYQQGWDDCLDALLSILDKAESIEEARVRVRLHLQRHNAVQEAKVKIYYLMSEHSICSFNMLVYASMYCIPFLVIV